MSADFVLPITDLPATPATGDAETLRTSAQAAIQVSDGETMRKTVLAAEMVTAAITVSGE